MPPKNDWLGSLGMGPCVGAYLIVIISVAGCLPSADEARQELRGRNDQHSSEQVVPNVKPPAPDAPVSTVQLIQSYSRWGIGLGFAALVAGAIACIFVRALGIRILIGGGIGIVVFGFVDWVAPFLPWVFGAAAIALLLDGIYWTVVLVRKFRAGTLKVPFLSKTSP